MNIRIENDLGVVLKVSEHKSDPTKVMLKVPAGCAVLITYVAKWCAEMGVTELGSAWEGKAYWMQEANREQVLGAIGQLLSGKVLPEVDMPEVAEEAEEAGEEEDEDEAEDEEGLSS